MVVSIVKHAISTPSYRSIYDTCEYAYDVTVEEKDTYESCTTRQLAQCNVDFASAQTKEEARVTSAFAHNSATLAVKVSRAWTSARYV